MRAIFPLLAALSLFLSACDVTSQEEATEIAVETRAAVTAEAATAQAQEASAAATAEAAVTPTEEAEGEADTSEEGDAESGETVTLTTSDGCEITFFGVLEAFRSQTFKARWRVICDGNPGSGTFFATLGDPPSSPDASHASGELNGEGEVTLELDVNMVTGETILYCSFGGEVYEVTKITISD